MRGFPKKPDRHDILAEVRRRGMTLSGIARDAGLDESAVRHGIARRNRRGAMALAEALGMPFESLFPGYKSYAHDSDANLSLKQPALPRKKAAAENAPQNIGI